MAGNPGEWGLSVSALEFEHDGPRAVVSLTGQADITDSGWIRLLLELQASQRQGRLVVDLSRLSSMDWWVALILAWASRVVSRRGGVLVLANPQPAVARLLDAAGVPGVTAMSDNVQPAGMVRSCRQGASASNGRRQAGRRPPALSDDQPPHALTRRMPGPTAPALTVTTREPGRRVRPA